MTRTEELEQEVDDLRRRLERLEEIKRKGEAITWVVLGLGALITFALTIAAQVKSLWTH